MHLIWPVRPVSFLHRSFTISLSDRRDIDQRQLLDIRVLQTGDERLRRVDGCQHIDACLDGVPTDHESVMAVLDALGRRVDNQIDLMSQDQIQNIRGFLLQFVA